ncbi:MAG: GNAT family N-acetyltransferase, partial [Synergistaceae bacterium]|nr:GNAT family N-acetyltransferase [Synergistaceae bacterium]
TMIETGKAIQFIILVDQRAIGSVYFRDIDNEHRKAEYGIFIGENNAINYGYGTAACKLACQYGFEKMKWHKIFLRVFASNQRAIRSYQKAGFIQEAILHDDVYVQGEFRDIILMGLINPNDVYSGAVQFATFPENCSNQHRP